MAHGRDEVRPGAFYIVGDGQMGRLPPQAEEWMAFRTTHYDGWLHLVWVPPT